MTETNKTFLDLLAFVYLENAQPHKAHMLLDALVSLDPASHPRRNALAWACLQMNQPKEALQVLDAAENTSTVPVADRRAAAYLRGQAHLRLGQAEQARAALAEFTQMRS